MDGPVDGTAMEGQNGDTKKLMDKKTNIEKEASKATPQETWDYSGGNAWEVAGKANSDPRWVTLKLPIHVLQDTKKNEQLGWNRMEI
jgi:hypothetical protein